MHNNQQSPDFIVIDDDPVNNKICERCIQIRFPGASVKTFTNPIEGFEHLEHEYSHPEARNAILFLDINMPFLSGWDVLDKMEQLPDATRRRFKTFILSSSVADEDKQRAYNNPLLSG